MADCTACGEELSLPFTCKFCNEAYCSQHRLPENHDCTGLDTYKETRTPDTAEDEETGGIVYQPSEVKHGTSSTVGGETEASTRQQLQRGFNQFSEKIGSNASFTILTVTVAISVAAFLVQDVYPFLSLNPSLDTLMRQPWTIITSMFIHAGPWHLFVNMMALFFFGPELERRIGTAKFVEMYFVAGVISALGYVAFSQAMQVYMGAELVPAVGASGAVFGVFAALAVLAPEISVIIFPVPVPIRIRTALAGLVVLNLFLLNGTAGIAGSAHLAGIVVGLWYGKQLEGTSHIAASQRRGRGVQL